MKLSRGQIIAHCLCLAPFALLLTAYLRETLGANPIQALTLRSGHTAVNLIMFTLTCRPLSNIFGLTALLSIRKTLGVYAFFYAAFHFLIFAGLDFEFNLRWIWDEVRFKPFIQIGLAALGLLIPLAVTSFDHFRRKMGRGWQPLHRLVYMIAILVIAHYLMAVKGDFLAPALYGLIFLILMLLRHPAFRRFRARLQPAWLISLNKFLLKS